jgi:hypothetical protein
MIKPSRLTSLALALCCFTVTYASGCSTKYLPGTVVEDTTDNRAVYGVILAYKEAFEKRNADGILELVSAKYYEDHGNGDPNDDYGYSDLKARVLPDTFKRLSEVQLELELKDILVKDNKGDRGSALFLPRQNEPARR